MQKYSNDYMMWEKFLVVARRKKLTKPLSSFAMMKLRLREIKWPASGNIAS